jgi:hypothetical protein
MGMAVHEARQDKRRKGCDILSVLARSKRNSTISYPKIFDTVAVWQEYAPEMQIVHQSRLLGRILL